MLLASAIGPEPDLAKAYEMYEFMMDSYAPQRREGLRPVYMMYLAAVHARAGQPDSARAIIRQARSLHSSADPEIYYYEANARLRLNEPDEALRLLQTYLEKSPTSRDYLAQDWWWEELRDDPRFQALVGGN